ncbi:MAG: penicillin-binding protein 2 [Ignavibacteriae bacterium]|nr:penicillin-binding protein 2 [Ignavibacteriota bacterium]
MSDKIFGSRLRRNIFIAVIIFVGVTFTFQLIKMQILEHTSYTLQSDNNSIKKKPLQAPRGIFFDRNLDVLVSNKPTYNLHITPELYDTNFNSTIEQIIDIEKGTINKIFDKNKIYSKYLPRIIKRDLNFSNVVWFEEHSEKLKGVEIIVEMQRDYSYGIKGSHIFGYLREINSIQLEKEKNNYDLGDFIGISGIERSYEKMLRGSKGYEFILVDSRRKTIGRYLEGSQDINPTKGKDLILTIDKNAQQVAETEFEGKTGSLVAIEPSTGEILAYVSAPEYDLEAFAAYTSRELINKLSSDPQKPLFDRAANSIYPPGSTYKMLGAIIGLEEKIIDEHSTVYCRGGFQFGNRFFKCHGNHGSISVIPAIEKSCNTFFYKLILDIGLDRWARYLRMFGFGNKTSFDLSAEAKGIVPDTEYYDRAFGKNKWTKGTLVSLGIGQGEFSVTTLQLAQYAALLANSGRTKTPHVLQGYIEGIKNVDFNIDYKDKIVNISQKTFDIVREGMFKVVNGYGTARHIKLPNINIAGKTGTSQNPHGEDHALFIGFAPYENPKIAVAVIVENVGFGGTHAAPIAQKVIKAYLENLEGNNFPISSVN